ncbi:unnamed protein product [Cladocopium goreaui]|uniref:Neurofilament heavy polypeptide n=1 Tax=Cladocopium goreaui TaxID=2562237 RepID=A0A9P1BWE7_9DINO|nr:unnamed protein product [Cladocopium goreaui]
MYSLSRDIYGNQFIFIDINPIHLNHYSSQVQPEAQESGDCVHHDTRELGVRSGKNDSRDFWKFNDIPVEIETVCVPVADDKSPRKLKMESFPILYPHRVLTYLFNEDVAEYWQHSREMGEPWAIHSPAMLLLEELQYFGAGTFVQQLDNAYKSFLDFCRMNKVKHSQPPFVPKMVTRPKTGEVGLIAKAWNGRCILSWLNHCLLDVVNQHGDNEKVVITSAALTLVIDILNLYVFPH